MHLSDKEFLEVIARTPLVSIDLIIKDPKNRILLGYRINEPAKDKWFVPGGRIKKGETIEDAFQRICCSEIKEHHNKSEARLIGVFTHDHDKNVFLVEGIRTHYVVLAYELRFDEAFELKPTEQHSKTAQAFLFTIIFSNSAPNTRPFSCWHPLVGCCCCITSIIG